MINLTNKEGSSKKLIFVSISDSGIGLQSDKLEHIFKPFEQVENSYSRKYQGTGLGLSMCRQLVELHHGKIWAESDGINQGSTFSFIIPN
jgi:signal transduction histidine kinase